MDDHIEMCQYVYECNALKKSFLKTAEIMKCFDNQIIYISFPAYARGRVSYFNRNNYTLTAIELSGWDLSQALINRATSDPIHMHIWSTIHK